MTPRILHVRLRCDDPERREALRRGLAAPGVEIETAPLHAAAAPVLDILIPDGSGESLDPLLAAGNPSRTWVLLPSERAGEETALLAAGVREVLPASTPASALVIRLEREAASSLRERELLFREEVLQLLIDAIPGCVGYIDINETFVFNNRVYESWFGIPWRDVPGMTVREILGQRNYPMMRPQIKATLEQGEETTFQDVLLLHDGTTRVVDGKRIPHSDASGNVLGYAILTWDRTADWSLQEATWFRKSLDEAATKTGPAYFGALTQQMAEILRFDEAMVLEWIGPDELQVLGTASGRTVPSRLPASGAPWDSLRVGDAVLQHDGAGAVFGDRITGVTGPLEGLMAVPLKDKAGAVIGALVLVHFSPILEMARTRAMLEIFASRAEAELERQRTEKALRSSEAKYRELFHMLPDAVLLADLDQIRVLDSNPAAQALFGYSGAEMAALHGLALSAEPDKSLASVETMRRGEPVAVPIRWMRRKDGTTFPCEVTASSLQLDGRRLNITVIRDITTRLQAEAKLRALSTRREHDREAERARISRTIHDEFGQKLTSLKIDLSMLEKRFPDASSEPAERLRVMKDLVDKLLGDTRRISTELRPPILDDMGLVAAIEWQLEDLQARTGMRTRLTVEPVKLAVEERIATTLFRILQEALTNVLRHAHANRVDVELRAAAGRVTLKVQDDGRGIPPKAIRESMSLGLIGMRERVAEHRGVFDIVGNEETGTRITVDLPMTPSAEE